jgi:glycosyltransferase involved in cell wall biosynthesis
LNGQSNYNVAMAAHLRTMGDVRIIDTGGGSRQKIVAYLRAAWTLLTASRRNDVIYTSAPGQGSLWIFGFVMLALRCRGLPFFVHHHSFRPMRPGGMKAMRFATMMGGRGQRHILLSEGMRRAFANRYLAGDMRRAFSLSNAYLFYTQESATERPDRPLTLGHMSVLAWEKGVDVVLGVFEELIKSGVDVRLRLAGPTRTAGLDALIAETAARHPRRFEFLGRVDGEAKRRFYDSIDLFLLPSRLPDEAEPLVLLEAYAAGVDVMATGRGCIPERLIASDRLLVGDSAVDTGPILAVADAISADWAATRHACREHAARMHDNAREEAGTLFAAMQLHSNLPWNHDLSID